MKTMKSIGIFLMLMMMSMSFYSCSEDYTSRLPELLVKDLKFTAEAGTQEMEFRNENMNNYEVSVPVDTLWCTSWIDYNASKLYVQLTANTTYDERSVILTLKDVKDNTTRNFTVTQAQTNAVIVNGNTYDVVSDGADVTVEVQHNVNYKVTIPEDVTWIHEKTAATRALVTSNVMLTVDANDSGKARSAYLKIQSEDGEISKSILIKQAFTPAYAFDSKSYTIDELEQTIQIKYTSNFKFNILPNADWIISEGLDSVADKLFVLNIKVKAFTEKKEKRTSTIDFFAEVETSLGTTRPQEDSVVIIQERILYFTPESNIKMYKGDSIAINDSVYNPKEKELTFKSSETSNFKVYKEGEKVWLKAVGEAGGSARITVSANDGKYSDEIKAQILTPLDMSKYLVCKWDSTQAVKEGIITKSLTFRITNTSEASIALKKYAAYKDTVDLKNNAIWYEENLSENLGKKGSDNDTRTITLGGIPTGAYCMVLTYEYLHQEFTLKFLKDGTMTITKVEAEEPAATTTSSTRRYYYRSRSRR